MRLVSLRVIYVSLVALVLLNWSCSEREISHNNEDHRGHDHAEVEEDHRGCDHAEVEEDHSGHDHAAEAQSEPGGITLDHNAQRIAGIIIEKIQQQTLSQTIELPGRIGFNEDRLVHISPRFNGLLKSLKVGVGSYVREGDILAEMENNETMVVYTLKAPISGTVIEKHATPGEFLHTDASLLVIANLSRVWVNCDVYAVDISRLKTGMKAVVARIGNTHTRTTHISYIAPVFDATSSTGLVRMVLSNTDKQWRPGMFIRATINIAGKNKVLAVPTEAVQTVDDERVLFIPGPAQSFFTRVVTIGKRTRALTEIVSGMQVGEAYVAQGAYELKATMVTRGMDPHAGHGH